MAAGPLPEEGARRRNTPTIPTTKLPAGGRKGRPPKCPYELRKAGERWWKWAWATPQAAAWDPGALYTVARRAQLEDDLAMIALVDTSGFLEELLGIEDERERLRDLEFLIGRLKALAGGELAIMKEQRELDNKLGLNPQALAALRWKIVDENAQQSGGVSKRPAISGTARGRAGLRAV